MYVFGCMVCLQLRVTVAVGEIQRTCGTPCVHAPRLF